MANILLSESHHAIEGTAAKQQQSREQASQREAHHHGNNGNAARGMKREGKLQCTFVCSRRHPRHSFVPAIERCSLPQGARIGHIGHLLELFRAHEAAGRLDQHDQQPGDDLEGATDQAAQVSGYHANHVPQPEEHSDWKVGVGDTKHYYYRFFSRRMLRKQSPFSLPHSRHFSRWAAAIRVVTPRRSQVTGPNAEFSDKTPTICPRMKDSGDHPDPLFHLHPAPMMPITRAPYFMYHGKSSWGCGSWLGRAISETNFSVND